MEADPRRARVRVGRGPRAGARRARPRARRRRLDRPGPPRRQRRRPPGGGQGPVPRDRRGGRVRHAKPAHAHPAAAAADARARGQGRARRARPAGDRGVRLRARGGEPPPDRPLLARSPVHRRPRRRHRAQPPPGAGHRLGRRDRLRAGRRALGAGSRPLRRDRLPVLLRERGRARHRPRRPPSGQLPALRGRPGRVLRLRHGPRAAAHVPASRGRGVRGDPRLRRPGAAARDARARLPARARGRMGRRRHPRGHARGRLVVSRLGAAAPLTRGPLAGQRFDSRRLGRRGLRAAAADDPAARGAAPAADGGDPVPDRLDRSRRSRLGRAPARAGRGRRAVDGARRAARSVARRAPRRGRERARRA